MHTFRANTETLRELREWMALGFYEAPDLPWPRAYGRAFLRLYENMEIRVPADGLLVPTEPFPVREEFLRRPGQASWRWTLGERHHATGFICDFMHHSGIHVNHDMAELKKKEFPQHAAFVDRLVADLQRRLPHFGGYTHSNPDIRRVVNEGFGVMERELDAQIAAVAAQGSAADDGERSLLAALKDYAAGVRAFHARTVEALREAARAATGQRQTELALVAESFAACFLEPSRTFVQGLLAVNFTWMLDGCDSLGRVDQALGALYEQDIASGALTRDFARRLLDELYAGFERHDGWNVQLGGYRPDGTDGYNALTHEMILACGRNRFRRPNVAFRVTRQTPREKLAEVVAVLREGSGRPAIYNDDQYIETLLNLPLGLTTEDARELGFGGCTETMIPGLSNVGSLEGHLNLAEMLELALNDGWSPAARRQVGPHTGAFESFADFGAFFDAVKRQIQYATDAFVAGSRGQLTRRFREGDPKLPRTMFTRDCVARRKSFEAGGARYNWSVVSYQGIANLIDGLAAMRHCVFETRSVAPAELLAALRADFDGHEEVRQRLLRAPKFGNDNAAVDALGAEAIGFAWRELLRHEPPRGGRYLPSCILFTTYGEAGRRVGATPDGRKAGEPLTDSVGPAQGRDTHGPTAMLNSVAKLPLHLAIGTPVLNMRFQKAHLADGKGLDAAVSLIQAFFAKGGLQIQVSVLSTAEMRAAQVKPEQYADLIVRIGGFSEYFTKLDRPLQESVIARTEHTV